MNKIQDSEITSIKIIILGDTGCGKTSLLLRYTSGSYSSSYISTIGIDFKIKNMSIKNKKIRLQIWDTAGQERFRTITQSYYRSSNGIILTYDVTNRNSFQNIMKWIADIKYYTEKTFILFLVANKSDMPTKTVETYEGAELAKKYDMTFFETSALSGFNVNELFNDIASKIVDKMTDDKTKNIIVVNNDRPFRSKCC